MRSTCLALRDLAGSAAIAREPGDLMRKARRIEYLAALATIRLRAHAAEILRTEVEAQQQHEEQLRANA